MSVAILGLGRFGTELAHELVRGGVEVLAVDMDGGRVNEMAEQVFLAAEGNISDIEFLQSLDLKSYDSVVVAVGSQVATSVLVTLTLKKRLALKHVVAKASNRDHSIALELAGADHVVNPEQAAAQELAHTLGSRSVEHYLSLGPEYGLALVPAPQSVFGRLISELDTSARYKVILLGRIRKDSVSFNPPLDEVIQAGDDWIIAGKDPDLRRFGD